MIWDWNGTLLNDVEENIKIVNLLLAGRSLPPITKETYKKYFRMPIRDFYRDIGFDFSEEPFERVAKEYNALYAARFGDMPLTANIEEILRHVSDSGIRQYIVSASEQTSLERQVSEKGIQKYFSKIVGNDDYSVVSKIDKAIGLIAEIGKGSNVLFVGDLYHDYEVARAIGADCILYRNGHQDSYEAGEYRVIDTMGELMQMLR